jgi:sulfur carrier protein
MRLIVNGQENHLENIESIRELLSYLDYRRGCFAVALNFAVVPRDLYESTALRENDVVEIVAPMQGG